MARYCYITGEDHRRDDGRYTVARIREDRGTSNPAMVLDTLEEAEAQVTTFNTMLGLTADDIAKIRNSVRREKGL